MRNKNYGTIATWMQNLKQNNIKGNIASFKSLLYHHQCFNSKNTRLFNIGKSNNVIYHRNFPWASYFAFQKV